MKPRQCPICKEREPTVAFYRVTNACKECHKRRIRDAYHTRRTPAAASDLDALTRTWGRT
jgi:hypothetical protein